MYMTHTGILSNMDDKIQAVARQLLFKEYMQGI